MNKKIFLVFAFALALVSSKAQIIYDFEDGNINGWTESTAGHWSASSDGAISGTFSLHHSYDNPSSGHDQISIGQNIDVTKSPTVWQFKVKYTYSPSSTNNWAIFLMSDTSAPYITQDSNYNGYAIGVDLFTESDDTLTFYRIDNGNVVDILKTKINWQNDIGYKATQFVVTRSINGIWNIFIATEDNYNNLQLVGSIKDSTYTNAKYFAIYYEYSAAQDQKLWFDDLKIYNTGNDINSSYTLTKSTDTIASTINTAPGVQILKLDLKDNGGDNQPTIIKQIIFQTAKDNSVDDLRKLILGCQISDGTNFYNGYIGKNTINFNGEFTINENNNITLYVSLWLKSQPEVSDNTTFDIKLESQNIITSPSGSAFATQTDSTNNITYSVTASKLKFSNVPLTVIPDKDFPITVEAVDVNGNIDLDINQSIKLELNSGTGILKSASGLEQNLINGIAQWSDLQYSDLGYFTLSATSSNFPTAVSKKILGNSYLYYLNDDFEDGDISDWIQQYPGHWIASDENPIQGVFSLKEVFDNDESSSELIIHHLVNVDFDTTKIWRFSIRYDNSSISSTNNWNVILMSDANPLDNSDFNGYVFGVNWNTTDDIISLWKIEDGNAIVVSNTGFNWEDNISRNEVVDFEISRSSTGQWIIKIDTTEGEFDNMSSLDTAYDNTFTNANYFGIRYKYTASYDQKLTFDNIYFGDIIPDTIPPHIDTAYAIGPKTVKIFFNEFIDSNSIDINNFSIGQLPIISATLSATNPKLITLLLGDSLKENVTYKLILNNIRDISGNNLISDSNTIIWQNLKILNYYFPDYKQIAITFNKDINKDSAEILSSYNITPLVPISNVLVENNNLILTFGDSLKSKQFYQLSLNKIYDNYGNKLSTSVLDFTFYIAKSSDVVINEILFDISPQPPALPPHKYIEIYNRTDIPLNLTNWGLTIGDSPNMVINNIILPAKGYAIICSPDGADKLKNFGLVIPILNESYLTISGKQVTLKNNVGKIIDQINYTPDWYNSDKNNTGGWSIERIDPNNLCYQAINWHVSVNPTGGTPGFKNSVYATNKDTIGPFLTNYQIISSNEIRLTFNEPISQASALNQLNFIINNSYTAFKINIDPNTSKDIEVIFAVNFNNGTNSIQIRNLEDLCGNKINDTLLGFDYQKIHLTYIEPISTTEIKLFFSENVDKNTAQNIDYYKVIENQAIPKLAIVDSYQPNIVYLFFDESFDTEKLYHLTIDSIMDLNGNIIDTDTNEFAIHKPQIGDIVFNEFMIDVSPAPQGLPQNKYIELFNTSQYPIWLTNWQLSLPSGKIFTFPEICLKPQNYLIITSDEAEINTDNELRNLSESYISYGLYTLKTNKNKVIDAIDIDGQYYNNTEKSNGGWSIEKINPYVFCQSPENWAASENLKGGTPGLKNSLFSNNNDITPPQIKDIKIINAKQFSVSFTQIMLDSSVFNTSFYKLENQAASSIYTQNLRDYIISYNDQMANLNTYNLQISGIKNNCGEYLKNFDTTLTYYKIHLNKLQVLDSNLLLLTFSESPSGNSAYNYTNYVLNQEEFPAYIVQNSNDTRQVYLQFKNNFKQGINKLILYDLTDVFGNPIDQTDTQFIYYIPDSTDIIINEILPHPKTGCSKYIEIYNKTKYPIQIKNLYLANYSNDSLYNIINLTDNPDLKLAPHEYLTISTDTENIKLTYPVHGSNYLQIKSFPKMSSDSGKIAILTRNNFIVDKLSYDKNMHNKLISDDKGVALERINPDVATNDKNNWTSASATVHYGTPSLKNSQYFNTDSLAELGDIKLSSFVFSPDDDGYQDLLHISITNKTANTFCTIVITNRNGNIIKHLVQNELISTHQNYYWDGSDDYGRIVKRNFYVIVIKLYTSDGVEQIYKHTIAIAKKQ